MGQSRRPRRLPPVLAVIAASLLICACGSSGKPPATAAGVDPTVRFAQCMRSHGVSSFPDPSADGGINIAPGVNPQSPAFGAAQQACQKLLPAKGRPPKMSASERQAALRFAQCLRAHGQSDFPDPTETPPPGTTRVLVLRGMVFALKPGVDPKSPGFRQAMTACGVRPPGQQSSSPP
jgi:hypothetical protein